MKQIFFLSIVVILMACHEQVSTQKIDQSNENNIDTVDAPKKVTRQEIVHQYFNDTFFLQRTVYSDYPYYHAVYIDTTRTSKYYQLLSDFTLGKYYKGAYEGGYKYLNEKYPNSFSKRIKTDLPQNWIPVYYYQDEFYLYAPSDWGTANRRIVNDSAFVYWYMDGPHPLPLHSIKKVNTTQYDIQILNIEQDENYGMLYSPVTVHIIDSKTKLAVFDYKNEREQYRYQTYIPAESVQYFDLVITHCTVGKTEEYRFEEVDYQKLLKK